MKTIISLAFLLVILAGALASDSYAQQRPAPPNAPTPVAANLNKLKAQNFTVTTLDGKRVSLNNLLVEGRPVVLDFWATWCGPCRQEIAHLKELSKKYSKDGVIVLGLNLEDPVEDQQSVRDFVKRNGMDYQSVFAPSQIYQFFNGRGVGTRIPQTIIFGADGEQIKRMTGYSASIGKEVLTAALERAVSGNRQRKLE